jgi:hypothetical protein
MHASISDRVAYQRFLKRAKQTLFIFSKGKLHFHLNKHNNNCLFNFTTVASFVILINTVKTSNNI